MENFIYRNNARKRSTTVILALIVTGIFIAWALLDAHIIVVASLIACVTLAIVDWVKNPKYVAEISPNN
ncbi:MAG: hypothetical protein ACPGRD_07010, partial [Planktomarina sp.]